MARLHGMAERHQVIGEVRGIGPMAAIELVKDRETREPAADVAPPRWRGRSSAACCC